jgi:hypothetical protein
MQYEQYVQIEIQILTMPYKQKIQFLSTMVK